jgi:hypothetical protein
MSIIIPQNEQRRFSRVPFVNDITLSQQGQDWQGTVVDICFNGILISGKGLPLTEAGTSVPSIIHFDNGIDITADLELVHQHGDFYGFHFSTIDSESLAHLRKLVSLNLGDESACQRELISLFSYHQ